MKKFIPLALLLLALPASASEIPLDPAFHTGVLENGLTWYVRTNDEPEERAFLHLIVKAGSLEEDDDQRGLAHFLEHMAFNGTENFEKQELIDYLESIGMEFGPEINAYTSYDETVYMLAVPTDDPQYLEQGFRILADWSRRISLDEDEVVRERGVVLDEWRGRLGARQRIRDREVELTYAGSRYAERNPIGDPDIIETAEPGPIRRFYEDWYRPELMAVVAVGDFDEERILELIHENFDADWGPRDPRPLVESEVQPHDETLWGLFEDPELTRSSIRILLKQPEAPVLDTDRYRQSVVSRLVQGMFSARMRELVDRNEAEFTSARIGPTRLSPNWIAWQLSVSARDGQLPPALEQVMTEWFRVREHGFTSTELEREKTSTLRILEAQWKDRDNQDSSRLARSLTTVFLGRGMVTGPEWTLETYREILPTVTLDEVQSAANELPFEAEGNRVVLSNSPEREGIAAPTEDEIAAAVAGARSAQPGPWVDQVRNAPLVSDLPAPGEIVDEKYDADLDLTTWILSNGVKVLIKPTDFNDDRFSLDAFSPGGRSLGVHRRDASEDLATSIVMSGGVADFSATELEKELAGALADARPTISTYEEGFSGGGSPDDLETALQLLWLRAQFPRRDETAFESLIQRYSTMLANRSLDPDRIYSDSLSVFITDHHPMTVPFDSKTVEQANLDESLAFYRDRFADLDDLVVILVGDLDLDALRPLAEQYLATLPATDREETWQDLGIRFIEGPAHEVVEAGMDDKARTTLMMHGEADWTRVNRYGIASLASGLEIRLREVLREDLSGTYGVSVRGSLEARPFPEWQLSIGFGCEPARLDELVAEAIAVIEKVRDEGLPDEVVEKVREQNLRANEENVRENGYWTSVIGFRERYGIDQREELQTREFLESFGVEQFREAARRFLTPESILRVDKIPAQGS